jgi:hypothetical protein
VHTRFTLTTIFITFTAKALQVNSLAAKEIRIIITSNTIREGIKAFEKLNKTLLLKANKAITKALGTHYYTSYNYNISV